MIAVAEASARILARIEPLAGEPIATGNAADRVLSESVTADVTSPPWDNSSMDGYAVRSADIAVGSKLTVIEAIPAGGFPTRAIGRDEAVRVMTGAPVPGGADSVIRHEDTDDGRDVVTIREVRDSGKNIRRRGEDFHAGDLLFEKGELLRVAHIGALASAGIKSVAVHCRPRVALISSGDELVTLDSFTPDLEGQRIVSANSITLNALVDNAGGEPLDLGIARDDPDSVREKLEAARGADLIITSAGISVGDHDHVRDVFSAMGGVIDFWKVCMRPGAPLAFGMLGGTPWIGLSGNPVSAMVTFEVFVRPVIRKMLGLTTLFPRTFQVTVSDPIKLAAPLMHFLRVTVSLSEGRPMAKLTGSQSSSVLTAMARANALLILPGDKLDIAAGEVHRALPLGDSLTMTPRLVLE